jgi:hypothetical protein
MWHACHGGAKAVADPGLAPLESNDGATRQRRVEKIGDEITDAIKQNTRYVAQDIPAPRRFVFAGPIEQFVKNPGVAKIAMTTIQASPLRIGHGTHFLSSQTTCHGCFASCHARSIIVQALAIPVRAGDGD